MDHEKMAQFIAELRKEKNITQKDLADQLGVTDKAVSKWERGLSCPDISLLSKLSQILGVTTSELLNGEKSQPTMPEVEAMVETTLQYADNATKNKIAQSTKWKFTAIASVISFFSLLVLLGSNWAIESGMKWVLLPISLITIVWLITILGVFMFGKNKIASLLLCGFIIYLTTNYYSILNQATTRDINAYGEFEGFTKAYIPHYTIIILMFVITTAILVISLLIQNKNISGDRMFLLFSASITVIILPVLTVSAIMDYVDIHGLGVNPIFTILVLLTILMNFISLALFVNRQRKQVAEKQA